MCGIFCYIGEESVDVEEAISVIHHRGPDADGFLTYHVPDQRISRNSDSALSAGNKVAFGFKRLAIIDLNESSNQPFSLESADYHIIFNGEIYNYIELRETLTKIGYRFQTSSDTEVLINAYKHWGSECFQKFNGMWSLAILDLKQRKLILSRDRFGIKPLYYHKTSKGIYFFSEIKQILQTSYKKEVNKNVIKPFLVSGILDASKETFFKGVYSFPAAHYAEISLDNISLELDPLKYWDLERTTISNINYPDAVERFRQLFQQSIELRFRSDVPVGACLSGGLDSSSIVSLSGFLGKRINTFTIDNKDRNLSEIQYVNDTVAKYSTLTSVVGYNEENDLDLLDNIFEIQDEPFAGLGLLAQWRVMKLASQNDVVVLLDGQGGDELLGGYRKFVFFYLKELLAQGKFTTALQEGYKFLGATDFKLFEKEGIRRYLNRTGVAEFLNENIRFQSVEHNIGIGGANGFLDKSYDDIFHYSYPQLLRFEDRNSMAFSLEARVPFLDYRLVEFTFSLPSKYKIHNGYTKAILRDSMKDILPDSVRLRKSKMGFATPEERWIKSTHRSHFSSYLKHMTNPYLKNDKIYADYESKQSRLDYKSLLRIYLFDRWMKKMIL